MEIAALKRDTQKLEAGEWVGDIPEAGDLRLRVRGLTSPTFTTVRDRLIRKVPRGDKQRDGTLKPDVLQRVMGGAMAEALLFDWDGLTDDGKPVPYSKELALTWLTEPDYLAFQNAVVWAARVVDEGRAATADDLAKNSGKPSAGK